MKNTLLYLASDSEQNSSSFPPTLNNLQEDAEFSNVFRIAVHAIEHRVRPESNYQGSGGSYFVKDVGNEKNRYI